MQPSRSRSSTVGKPKGEVEVNKLMVEGIDRVSIASQTNMVTSRSLFPTITCRMVLAAGFGFLYLPAFFCIFIYVFLDSIHSLFKWGIGINLNSADNPKANI